MTSTAMPGGPASSATPRRGLAALTPSGRSIVPASWARYNFAKARPAYGRADARPG